MANNYFQFKQFKIQQEKCAMKVCTDACLFGAIVAKDAAQKQHVLDIGTGTGLLSLMYAQENNFTKIDAVEIDNDAFEQAKQNVCATEWKDNIQVFLSSIQAFSKKNEARYDLIFSNPPFYEHDLKSADVQRNRALHSSDLSMQELVSNASHLLKENGLFCVLLPFSRMQHFLETANKERLFLSRQYLIRQTEKHGYFRCILFLSKFKNELSAEEISIKENDVYSLRFQELLKDYYLYL